MADKEATVYIVDLGSTMGECNSGRAESDLDWSMRYVWDKIGTTVAASRKTWNVGVLGLRTQDTFNPLESDDGYENISILQPLGPMTMSNLRNLQEKIAVHDQTTGDAVSAIIVAVDMIEKFTKKLKYKRKVILVTDGMSPIDGDNFGDICDKMDELGIDLVVLGVDFDDLEYGFKEEDKPRIKAKNEKLLQQLCDQRGEDHAMFGTMAEAIDEMDAPRLKPVRPYRNYEGLLTLGNLGDGEDGLPRSVSISIERYFKTHLAKPVSATTVIVKADETAPESEVPEGEDMEGVEFSAVHQARTYKVVDPAAPGGKIDVQYEDLAKGYEYGRTAVHISESEYNITKLDSEKSFTILGFLEWRKFEPFLTTGDCCQIVASRFNETSALALSSFIHALWELESFAVARLVVKDYKEPQLVLLMPGPQANPECLYDIPLPYAEDVRSYQFPPLDKVITISGATLTKHRNLPSDDLLEAMSEYVDTMSLSTFDRDDEGQPTEYCAIDDTYNPTIHRLNQAIRTRATHPSEPVPPPAPVLLKYSQPPARLLEAAKPQIEDLIEVAEVKKVPPKTKGKRSKSQREPVKPLSGLDIDALLSAPPTDQATGEVEISADNSIPEFKRALNASDELSTIESASKKMGQIVRDLVTSSLGDANYDRAAENMRVMRGELIKIEEPTLYNSFVKDLKKKLLSGELGGDRREMWWQIRSERLGLISMEQSEVSDVGEGEAREFYTSR